MESQVKQEKDSNWKVMSNTDWKIRIPRLLYDKIFMYTHLVDTEIAGFGDVEVDKDAKEYKITALRMYKQKVTSASVDQDEKSLLEAMEQAVLSGDDLTKIKFEWHSHVNMGVFWSGTDDECCKTLVNGSKTFFLFFVVNKKGELLARADYLFKMDSHTIQLTNYCIPVVVEEPVDTSLEEVVKADIEKYIETTVVQQYTGHGYGGHGYDDDRDYLYTYLCDTCKIGNRKTRWHQDTHNWICKDCFDSIGKKKKDEVWCKCEECNSDARGRWDKGRWLCYTCIRRERIDLQREQDKKNTFQDDRGRHWFWGVCQTCVDNTGMTTYEEYVTNVKEAKLLMCDQCYEEYELEAKKETSRCRDVVE